jgi:hypothetical protein
MSWLRGHYAVIRVHPNGFLGGLVTGKLGYPFRTPTIRLLTATILGL